MKKLIFTILILAIIPTVAFANFYSRILDFIGIDKEPQFGATVVMENRGGTGTSTYVTGDILYASSVNNLYSLPIGSDNQILTVSGGIPSWGAAPDAGLWVTTTDTDNIIPRTSTAGIIVNASSTFTSDVSGEQFFGELSNKINPAYSFQNDSDTGMYRDGSNFGFSVDATKMLTMNTSYIIGWQPFIGQLESAADPTFRNASLPTGMFFPSTTKLGFSSNGTEIARFGAASSTFNSTLTVEGAVTSTDLALTSLTTCTLKTDGVGNIYCGSDNVGGGGALGQLGELTDVSTSTIGAGYFIVRNAADNSWQSTSTIAESGDGIITVDNLVVGTTLTIPDNSVDEADINFSTACAAGNHYYLNGNDLACEADDNTTYTASNPVALTGTVFGIVAASTTEWETAWTHSQDNTQAHSDYLLNNEADTGIGLTLTVATTTGATSTHLYVSSLFGINSEYFTDLTGTGLQNSSGVLTLNATGDWTGTLDGRNANEMSNWQFTNANAISPTSTVGLIVNASSTFTGDFSVGTSTPALFVDEDTGYVGIGTRIPTQKLHLKNEGDWIKIGVEDALTQSYFGYTGLAYKTVQVGNLLTNKNSISLGADITANTSGSFSGKNIVIPNDSKIIAPNSANDNYRGIALIGSDDKLYLGGGGTNSTDNSMVIDTIGNVGIGTTGPDRKLDILDNTNPQLRLTHTDGSVYVDLRATSTGDLIITGSGGKVGIGTGTTAPGEFLTIESSGATAGDATIRLQAAAGNLTKGTIIGNLKFYSQDASTGGTGETAKISAIGGTAASWAGAGRPTDLAFYTQPSGAAASLVEAMRIDENGNVGIGTDSPSVPLHIIGTSGNFVTFERDSSTAGSNFLRLYNSNTTDGNEALINFASDTTGGGASSKVSFARIGAQFITHDSATISSNIYFETANAGVKSEKIRIQGNGNLGIGTTEPSEKLHISGGVAIYDSDRSITDLHHLVDKEYVDKAVTALGARYYMLDTNSGEVDYKDCSSSPSIGGEQNVSAADLSDDDYIKGWIAPNVNEPDKLLLGVYNWRIYVEKTAGTQELRLYWKLIERKNDDSEIVVGTSTVSNEITTGKNSYIIPLTLSEDHDIASDSYVVGKIYADISGGGSAPSITLYYEGNSASHWEIPTNVEIFNNLYVNIDGDTMTGNLTAPNLYASNGMGVGTITPKYTLHIDGTLGLNNTLYATSSIFDTSLEIPNGADPQTGVAGQIAIDTTPIDTLKYYGSATNTIVAWESPTVVIASSTWVAFGKFIPARIFFASTTVTEIRCKANGGTSVEIWLSDGVNDTDTLTCTTAGAHDDGDIANASFDEDEQLHFEIGNIVGTVNSVAITVNGYRDYGDCFSNGNASNITNRIYNSTRK